MRLRLPLIALVGLLGCSTSTEDTASETDGSSGRAETGTSDPSGSGVGTTTGGATGQPVSDESTSGAEESGGTTASAESTSEATTLGSSGTGQTSADETGGGEGPSAQCVELESCCDEIGSALFGGCMSVVEMGSPALCDSILTNYHQEGYCTGETFCTELGDCCDELPPGPGWQETCEYYADFGNQPQCAMLIGDYQLSDYCL